MKRALAAPHDFKLDTAICMIKGQAEREDGTRYPYVLHVGTHEDDAYARQCAEAEFEAEWEAA